MSFRVEGARSAPSMNCPSIDVLSCAWQKPEAWIALSVVAPTAERSFHIAECRWNFRRGAVPPRENLFCIAKTRAYLIEKTAKFISYVLYKSWSKGNRAAVLLSPCSSLRHTERAR